MLHRFSLHIGFVLAFLASHAAFADTVSPQPEPNKPFFGWMSRAKIQTLPLQDRPPIDPVCPGAWVTPIAPKTKIGKPEDSNIELQADNVHYTKDGVSTLQGNVSVQQPGRQIDADNAEITQELGKGRFKGNILIAEPGLVLTGDQADFDFETREARIERTEFVSSAINAHGRADQIVRNAEGLITIEHGEYSTCPPNDRTWFFVASDIRLDQQSGRGEVRDATLRIKDVPIIYFPYFDFPIDDRRQSGMLIPRLGNTNDGGFDLAVPIYLNIAPNYDATLTPRLMARRGAMLEGEFRYLLPRLGEGSFTGAFLPSDPLYQDRDRKSFRWKQSGVVAPHFQLNTDVNYVSDNAYFVDLGTDLNLAGTTFQERTGELIYNQQNLTITGRVQSYQTIDPFIPDAKRPYSRLPQLLLSYSKPSALGLETSLSSELAFFYRPINDLSGPEVNGTRYRIDPSVAYHWVSPWGFFTPKAGVRGLAYALQGSGTTPNNSDHSFITPFSSLDSGLIFEREQNGYLQTLEPRAFYLLAPYRDQSMLPNFDTANTTFSYQQLFRDSRFSGNDRLDDANQLSLGLTSRILHPNSGEEVIRASIGQAFYFRDRKVTLPGNPVATDNNSGLVAELSAPIGRGWSGLGDAQWSSDREYLNQYSLNFNYLPESRDRLANFGYNFRRNIPAIGQTALRQANFSIVQPVGISWQLIGLLQYDTRNREIQEALAGLQYEACCWKVRVYQRQFLADPNNISPGAQRERKAFFLEVELKGLAGLSSGIRSLLTNNMFGYNQLASQRESHSSLLREETP